MVNETNAKHTNYRFTRLLSSLVDIVPFHWNRCTSFDFFLRRENESLKSPCGTQPEGTLDMELTQVTKPTRSRLPGMRRNKSYGVIFEIIIAKNACSECAWCSYLLSKSSPTITTITYHSPISAPSHQLKIGWIFVCQSINCTSRPKGIITHRKHRYIGESDRFSRMSPRKRISIYVWLKQIGHSISRVGCCAFQIHRDIWIIDREAWKQLLFL